MSGLKNILVVDDERDCQEFIKTVLEMEGFEVSTAKNGKEGVEKALQEKPDLIILDVQMPVKDGFQTFYEIKTNDIIRETPVIMLTGIREKTGIGFSAKDMKEFMDIEPNAYLEKPIDPEKLKETARKVLGLA